MNAAAPKAPTATPTTSIAGAHALVVGCGITGLAAALALSERGIRVTLLERDAEPATETASAAFDHWKRKGAVQVRHSHVFLGRLRNLLRDRHPELLRQLIDAGARELRMLDTPPQTLRGLVPEPGDDDLVILGCRRTTLEWVIRRYVLARPNVTLLGGATVVGLSTEPGCVPHVTGLRIREDGSERELAADFVVDASGRQSQAPKWLVDAGARAPEELTEPSGIVYYTRFYRLRPGAEEPRPDGHPGAADYNWIKYAIFPADDRTFSITLAASLAFPEMKVLARADAFEIVANALPAVARWVDPARSEPIGDPEHPVQAMGGLVNRLRRYVDAHGPLVTGLFVLGDAAYCTNPLYGRGCSQGFVHAELLATALERHGRDWRAVALEVDAGAKRDIEPYYRASLAADRDAQRKAEGRVPKGWRARLATRFFEDGVGVAVRCDPVVYRAFVRMMNMLETPEQAFSRPSVLLRAGWVMLRGKRRNAVYALPPPPDRAAVLAACAALPSR
ncbi:FAD-dependent oxidoreductase [Candidatus Binatia bacterium]|jgi:2-polyprenyl-6-methoxyphenol hydroxylase-like FAD-dependent oxidoreductase|nr:FAD-dependent oxidoreductase [Candidatus Binatia bacterium]